MVFNSRIGVLIVLGYIQFCKVISKILFILFMGASIYVAGQNDSVPNQDLETIFVTSHRDGRKLSALSTSALYISPLQIKQSGTTRLQQILSEQPGINIVPQVNGLGSGIQLQGFNPEYTMILIDGEPVIGRNTGLLDLNRITLNQVKQIEIVKGPSSSLYGSEALAGVVNIITDQSHDNNFRLGLRESSHATTDINGMGSLHSEHGGLLVQASRYATQGYDLAPESYGKTVSPHQQWNAFAKYHYNTGHHEFLLSGRYFDEHQQAQYLVNEIATSGHGLIRDWMINPVWKYKMTERLHSVFRTYYTKYDATALLLNDHTGETISQDDFHQSFTRLEWNPKYLIDQRQTLIGGLGYVHETVNTIRYGNGGGKYQNTSYEFVQYTLRPSEAKEINLGLRYDHNNVYGGQLSPKVSFITPLFNNVITWNGSIGSGFKSPDFRQLYLDFTNAAGGGYRVYGREVLSDKLIQIKDQISGYLKDISNEPSIRPESSFSINTGITWKTNQTMRWNLSYFRNNVTDLIETEPIAQLKNGSNIYSYFNINKVRIEGADLSMQCQLNDAIKFTGGYELLYAYDLNQLDLLKAGKKYRRDPASLSSVLMSRSDYYGLSERSRHNVQFSLLFQPKESVWNASIRMQYRSKFGIGNNAGLVQGGNVFVSEKSGNDILDRYDDFVHGYALVHANLGYNGFKKTEILIGIQNILNKTIPSALPTLAPRSMYVNINYTLSKNKN